MSIVSIVSTGIAHELHTKLKKVNLERRLDISDKHRIFVLFTKQTFSRFIKNHGQREGQRSYLPQISR